MSAPAEFGLRCTVCGVEHVGHAGDSFESIAGWEFTTDTGWHCPNHPLAAGRVEVSQTHQEPEGNEMRLGTRVVLVSSRWVEREGCTGTVVEGPTLSSSQVAVKLDHDPLFDPRFADPDQSWTCIVQRRMLRRASITASVVSHQAEKETK